VIPYGRQSLDDDDVAAVLAVLKGDWLTQGPHVQEFEEALAERTGARHAISFSSGTAALHAVGLATGLGPGDLVVTSPLSFVASANCARYAGANAGFLDIDPATLNMGLASLPPGAAGVVAVHYAGLPVVLATLPYRPRVVIEDAAHALGASTPDGPVGNCARSDACIFSFHPVKAITTGEGGAVTTNDAGLANQLRLLRSHHVERRPEEGAWYYEVTGTGFNYRMTDIQAALGLSQLAKLDRLISRRRLLADRYRELLAGMPLELPPAPPAGTTHAWHLFPIRVADRRRVFDGLRASGIGVQVHYVPIYRHPTFAPGIDRAQYPETERAYEQLISLPLFPDLTEPEQDTVIARLAALL
jgi:perosamine synthetase